MSKSFISTSSREKMGLLRVARKGLAQKKQQESLGWVILAHWEVREKRPQGQVQGIRLGRAARYPLPQSLGDACLCKKELVEGLGQGQGVEEERDWCQLLPREKAHASCILWLLSLSLSLFFFFQAETLREVSGEGLVEYLLDVQVCPFWDMAFSDQSVTEKEVFSHCSWFWHHPSGFVAFLGLELKYN